MHILFFFISGLPRWLSGKESACQAGDAGSILALDRSHGDGNDNPLQYSCLENPVSRGAGQAKVLGGHKESEMTERVFTYTHYVQSLGLKEFKLMNMQILFCSSKEG